MNLQSISTSHMSKYINYFPLDLVNPTHIAMHTILNTAKHMLYKMAEIPLLTMKAILIFLPFNSIEIN